MQVYAWVTVGEQHYLVMQYVAGGSLADLLKAEGPLDWQRAARYVADVGEGLLEVHAQGIVHRDVKPSNILWDPKKDEAVLTDFGVGRGWPTRPRSPARSPTWPPRHTTGTCRLPSTCTAWPRRFSTW